MATPRVLDNGAARAAYPAGGVGGSETDGGARPATGSGGRRRSVYLMESAPAWGSAATRGRRAAMEDASAAVPRFAEVPVRMLAGARELDAHGIGAAALKLPLHLFGVYDGHGGSEVANYCADRMHVVLKEALGRTARAGLEESGERLDIKELWEKVFGGCFQRLDDEVSGQASRFCSSGVSSEARCKPVAAGDVGSTAAVAVVCSSHIVVANCGDSRVVLSRGKEPVALSDDHKPDREDERARIEAAGGRVIDWNGHRVSGVLAMSRSIGDGYGKPFLIPTPEVKVIPRAKDDDCLVIASDGLWDVISNADACKVARLQILQWHRKNNGVCSDEGGEATRSHPAAQAAAGYLVKLALMKGSTDNITVTVIDLKRRKKIKDKSKGFV
ncbi:hypothetical protein C2845_PM07G20810 [Panicum miliaceum]|uniref:protein-serine/threonine phosphatase n=1 Tax=Panicum miliaceum TaxID=4540 RepID=A0A3L6SIJ6_PANMI|nr:hypothetical protein C2845_PM07G20810 [Panicum miliaceum]